MPGGWGDGGASVGLHQRVCLRAHIVFQTWTENAKWKTQLEENTVTALL